MDTVNQEIITNEEQNVEKTFTQAEVDAIINGRFGRMMEKYKDYDDLKAKAEKFDQIEEESKSELQKATERADSLQAELDKMKTAEKVRAFREEVSKETGVPAHLLHGASKEECEAQAKDILAYANPNGSYPEVEDKGEVQHVGGGSTREQFASWFNNMNE